MKVAYINKRFHKSSLTLIATMSGIADDYRRQGFKLSVRAPDPKNRLEPFQQRVPYRSSLYLGQRAMRKNPGNEGLASTRFVPPEQSQRPCRQHHRAYAQGYGYANRQVCALPQV